MIALADNGAIVTILRFQYGAQCITFRIEYQTYAIVVVQLLYNGCRTTVGRNEECTTVWSFIGIRSSFLTRLVFAFTFLVFFHQPFGSFTQFVVNGNHNLAAIFQRTFAHTSISHNKEVKHRMPIVVIVLTDYIVKCGWDASQRAHQHHVSVIFGDAVAQHLL